MIAQRERNRGLRNAGGAGDIFLGGADGIHGVIRTENQLAEWGEARRAYKYKGASLVAHRHCLSV
jgi:hypothetical protein